MIRRIGLTGGIACGKSVAEQCFLKAGCHVLDADAVVHELEAPGGLAVAPIIAHFGTGVRAENGGIDVAQLAHIVFHSSAERQALEQIIFPLIRVAVDHWLEGKEGIAIFSAALLYESGFDDAWPEVVCVVASEATQLRRMMQVRGLSEAAAKARLAAQWPLRKKADRAKWILNNDVDDITALEGQIDKLVTLWKQTV